MQILLEANSDARQVGSNGQSTLDYLDRNSALSPEQREAMRTLLLHAAQERTRRDSW
jgi:hypothetical protein